MAFVPDNYVARLPVASELELQQWAGVPLVWAGANIPPPTLGTWMLLEVLDSAFVKAWPEVTGEDIMLAAWVMYHPRARAGQVFANWRHKEALAAVVGEWAAGLSLVPTPDPAALHEWLQVSLAGYAMLPEGGRAVWDPYLYGAPTLGLAQAVAGPALHATPAELLWAIPLVQVGFTVGGLHRCARNDHHVERPFDPMDIRRQLKLANEREARGELHPWQELEPHRYALSDLQKQHPGAVARFAVCYEAHKAGLPPPVVEVPDAAY